MWEYMGGWGGMGFGMMGMLLFWILLIVAIVLVVKVVQSGGVSQDRKPDRTALDILKERYVRGEIDHDEFEQKKRDLGE